MNPAKRAKRPKQLSLGCLSPGGRGGPRPGAGRPKKPGAGVSHATRPTLSARHPVHVTLRVRRGTWNLRSRRCFRPIERALLRGGDRFGLRVVHFSVQGNHLHLLCEANDERCLSRGLQGLCIRVAKGLNRVMHRHGAVFADRYHARTLRTPAEVRAALAYVLENRRHHLAQIGKALPAGWLDPFSSACHGAPRAAPRSWILRVGWRHAAPRGTTPMGTTRMARPGWARSAKPSRPQSSSGNRGSARHRHAALARASPQHLM